MIAKLRFRVFRTPTIFRHCSGYCNWMIYCVSVCFLMFVSASTTEAQDPTSQCSMNDSEQCSAVILYEPDKAPLARYRKEKVSVSIGNHNLVLNQDWSKNGVAGVVWDSAVVLARYMSAEGLFAGKTVLELGAGLGVPSTVAALDGASSVLSTDVPSAVPLLRKNIRQNTDSKLVRVAPLDWTSFSKPGQFDLVVGADLVYIQEMFPHLLSVLIQLASQNSTIYMSSKIRYPKDSHFYEMLSEHCKVEQILYDKDTDVHVYRIVRL